MKNRKKQKIQKGQYGYAAWGKKFSALRTVLYFGLSAVIFVMGWVSTGNKMNLLTVVAVLGVLPASKSAVNMIMYLKSRGCTAEAHERISACEGNLDVLYDLMMTTYDATFQIASLALRGRTICGFTQDLKCDEKRAQTHIEETLRMDGHKDFTVKIFHDLDKYIERLQQINRLDGETRPEEESGSKMERSAQRQAVIDTLLAVSL